VKSLIACLASCVLVSCVDLAVIDHDATHDPIAAEIAGRCFALQQDVWIVKESLIPVRYTFFIPTQICTAADGTLSSGNHCYVKQLAAVPRGSELVVTDVIDKAVGESGRCWQVLGVLKDDRLHQGKIEIPSCGFKSIDRPWIRDWIPGNSKGDVVFEANKLKRCDSSASTP
jgi:hypothetical protein